MAYVKVNGVWRMSRDSNCYALWQFDIGCVLLNEGGVSIAYDQAMSGEATRAFAQSTKINQPPHTAQDSDFAGHGSITLSANRRMVTGTITTLSAPKTIYAVVKTGDMAGVQTTLLDGQSVARYAFYAYGGKLSFYGGNTIQATTTLSSNTCYVLRAVVNGASSALYVGASTSPLASGDVGSGSPTQLLMGATLDNNNPWLGKVAMLGIFSGSESVDLQVARAKYLAQKYGVAV